MEITYLGLSTQRIVDVFFRKTTYHGPVFFTSIVIFSSTNLATDLLLSTNT